MLKETKNAGAQLKTVELPGKYVNINEITIFDHHRIVYCGSFKEFYHSDDSYIKSLRENVTKRTIEEKVYYKDKLFIFLSQDSNVEYEPIAHLVLGGDRDA